MHRSPIHFTILLFLMESTFLVGSTTAKDLTQAELTFFESKIRPVLIRECYGCHSNKSGNVRGGLRLDTKQLMHIGGSSGPAVVPGNLEESWLYNAISYEDFEMPPNKKLPQPVINDFKQWIEMGAPDPRVNTITKVNSKITAKEITAARETFWAYQKPTIVAPQPSANSQWAKSEIDKYIVAKLDEAKLRPAADAEPRTVVRRLFFDLIGLPPTPQETQRFAASWARDPGNAVKKVVDQLLDSERFGERWGRHWLDVARYAESTGREVNMTYPQAWRYRDYVIDAFNEDKPFDRFVQEQIAGDLLPVRTDEQWAKNLVATTFLAIGAKNVNEQNPVQFASDVADEQIDATTRVFLGMSVACARCHDHKFDAIPQSDYYAMVGIFQSMKTYFGNPQSQLGRFKGAQEKQTSTLLILPIDSPDPYAKNLTSEEREDLRSQIIDIRREMIQTRRNGGGGNAANAQRQRAQSLNRLAALSAQLASVDSNGKPLSFAMGVQQTSTPSDAKLLVRGEIDQQAQTVNRGFPQVLTTRQPRLSSKSSGRLELARWIGSDENPLTARVMVNRIWLHMFGQGIVTSTENFGTTGQQPSHPHLLDYLAVKFMQSGWSVKSVIREIANSRTYRMRSSFVRQSHEQDPDNRLLWRTNSKRLEAEALRDAMLSVSGEIDLNRPEASLVAAAGYSRVSNGQISIRSATASRTRPGAPGQGAGRFQQGGQQRNGQPGRFRGVDGQPEDGVRRNNQATQPNQNRAGERRPPGQQQGQRQFGQRPNGRFGQGRPGQGRPVPGRPGMRPGGPRRRLSNPLDMVDAKFRSVYLPIVRDNEPRSLHVFDFADSSVITGQRETSSTANQALYMLNNPFVIQQSEAFADRIITMTKNSKEQVQLAFAFAYGRAPSAGERVATAAFLRQYVPTGSFQNRTRAKLVALCQSLFASAEFRFLD